ncbi:hypothetical protein D3C72_2037170 [compost metagenome]
MAGEGAGLERGQDVGLHRIAGHHRLGRAGAVAGEDAVIGRAVLFRHDLDGGEEVAQARGRQLALLIHKVALGDQDQTVFLGQFGQNLVHAGQGLDRVGQHLAAGG